MNDSFDYTNANRAAWNEAADVHAQHNFERLARDFAVPGFSLLDQTLTGLLEKVGLAGTPVAQLQCNNGRELLSIKNLGAGRCIGFDISEAFIEQAQRLAASGGIDCEFVASNIYEIPSRFNAQFGLVFISVGSLGWIPDLDRYFQVAARLLHSHGWLLIYEEHPILDMFEPSAEDPMRLYNSYFKDQPFIDQDGLDYYGNTTYDSLPTYWFHHKLSDIFTAMLAQGLVIQSFQEYAHDLANVFSYMEQVQAKPPLSYSLLARLE